jgi:hypothetical protein
MESIICPLCESNMKHGRAAIRKHIGAKMRWPFPSDRLFFMPDDGNPKSETVVREGRAYEAFMCSNCGAVLLSSKR